jgi:hypothetical protein
VSTFEAIHSGRLIPEAADLAQAVMEAGDPAISELIESSDATIQGSPAAILAWMALQQHPTLSDEDIGRIVRVVQESATTTTSSTRPEPRRRPVKTRYPCDRECPVARSPNRTRRSPLDNEKALTVQVKALSQVVAGAGFEPATSGL